MNDQQYSNKAYGENVATDQVSSPQAAIPGMSGGPGEVDPLSIATAEVITATLETANSPHNRTNRIIEIRKKYLKENFGYEMP